MINDLRAVIVVVAHILVTQLRYSTEVKFYLFLSNIWSLWDTVDYTGELNLFPKVNCSKN